MAFTRSRTVRSTSWTCPGRHDDLSVALAPVLESATREKRTVAATKPAVAPWDAGCRQRGGGVTVVRRIDDTPECAEVSPPTVCNSPASLRWREGAGQRSALLLQSPSGPQDPASRACAADRVRSSVLGQRWQVGRRSGRCRGVSEGRLDGDDVAPTTMKANSLTLISRVRAVCTAPPSSSCIVGIHQRAGSFTNP